MSVFSYISQPRGFALMRIVCEGMADSIFVWLCLSFLLNSKSSISCLLSLVYHLYYRHFSQIYYLSLNFVNGSFHTLKFEILHSLVHMSFFCSFRVSNLRKFTQEELNRDSMFQILSDSDKPILIKSYGGFDMVLCYVTLSPGC